MSPVFEDFVCSSLSYGYVQYSNFNAFYIRYCNAYNSQANYSAVFQSQRPSKRKRTGVQMVLRDGKYRLEVYAMPMCADVPNDQLLVALQCKIWEQHETLLQPRDRPTRAARRPHAPFRHNTKHIGHRLCAGHQHTARVHVLESAEGDRKYPLDRSIRAAQTGRKQCDFEWKMHNCKLVWDDLLYAHPMHFCELPLAQCICGLSSCSDAAGLSDVLYVFEIITIHKIGEMRALKTPKQYRGFDARVLSGSLYVALAYHCDSRPAVYVYRLQAGALEPLVGKSDFQSPPVHVLWCDERLLAATAQELMALLRSQGTTDALECTATVDANSFAKERSAPKGELSWQLSVAGNQVVINECEKISESERRHLLYFFSEVNVKNVGSLGLNK